MMVYISRESFDKYSTKVKPNENFAQILIRIDSDRMLNEAKTIINEVGIRILRSKQLLSGLFLFVLDTKDMRDAVLKLTENGFSQIKGYNAVSFKTLTGSYE
ncbi:MAG: hypothetical protein ABSH06_08920 [Thermodesulfobacteriota bacterium]